MRTGGVYDFKNFLNKNNSKWPEVKIFFFLDLFLTNVLELYIVKSLYQKDAVLGNFFNQNAIASTCLLDNFVYFGLLGVNQPRGYELFFYSPLDKG